jgi:hypothetical protein
LVLVRRRSLQVKGVLRSIAQSGCSRSCSSVSSAYIDYRYQLALSTFEASVQVDDNRVG